MGQGIGVREEYRAARLIEDGNVVARKGGCCVGNDRSAPASTTQGMTSGVIYAEPMQAWIQ